MQPLRKKKSKIFKTLVYQCTTSKSNLNKRNSYKEVRVGDIVVFNRTHVEIVTKVIYNIFSDDGFCSVGVGRADHPDNIRGDGEERCDQFWGNENRELKKSDNRYYYL